MTRAPAENPILVVDDEKNIRQTIRWVLEGEGFEVLEAASIGEALSTLATTPVELVLLDVKLREENGLDLLERLRRGETGLRDLPVLVVSGHATIEDAVRATKNGAYDFLEKPLDRGRILVSVRNALEARRMGREVASLRAAVAARHEMIGTSPAIQEIFRQIAKVGPTKGRVLITGESGTGKELIARAIHRAWAEAMGKPDAPFVKVNCAAIPPELIESELFGHERGAFTGAVGRKRGLFELADGGTIFLDEIGDMSPNAQAKVLRVLQQNEIVRVGGEKVIPVDCRVLAATNKDLEAEVAAGRFREDLFFRLNVIPLRSPPLRERLEDIPLLAEQFVRQCCEENGFRPKRVAPGVLARLQRYSWPGNVRELKNVIERLVIMSDDEITERDLPPYLASEPSSPAPSLRAAAGGGQNGAPPGRAAELLSDAVLRLPLREFREVMEREYIRLKLEEHDWNISRTAQALGIERTNLHKKMRALGIDRE